MRKIMTTALMLSLAASVTACNLKAFQDGARNERPKVGASSSSTASYFDGRGELCGSALILGPTANGAGDGSARVTGVTAALAVCGRKEAEDSTAWKALAASLTANEVSYADGHKGQILVVD